MMFDEVTRRVVWEVEGPLTALAVYEISIHAKVHAIESGLTCEAHPADVANLKVELHKEENYFEAELHATKVSGINLVTNRDLQEGRWRVSGVLGVSKREWDAEFSLGKKRRGEVYDELMSTLKAFADREAGGSDLQEALLRWKKEGYPGADKN
jgi:hypothetical protein